MKLPATSFKIVTAFLFAFFFALPLQVNTFAASPYVSGTTAIDISYPNCEQVLPTNGNSYIIGVTGGKAFTTNPCLPEEAEQFSGKTTLYMNLNAAIGPTAYNGLLGPKVCKEQDQVCQNFNYGYQAAQDAYSYANKHGVKAPFWWFDIETANSWNRDVIANQQVILGAKHFFTEKHIKVGVYSASFMWQEIMGGWQYAELPVWIAPAVVDGTTASTFCSSDHSFTNGPVALVQYGLNGFDTDYACPSWNDFKTLTQALQ